MSTATEEIVKGIDERLATLVDERSRLLEAKAHLSGASNGGRGQAGPTVTIDGESVNVSSKPTGGTRVRRKASADPSSRKPRVEVVEAQSEAAPAEATPEQPKRRGGRPRGSGGPSRQDQALAIVGQNPGIIIPDIATHMEIEPNYLYRVMPGLEEKGLVVRNPETRGWTLKEKE